MRWLKPTHAAESLACAKSMSSLEDPLSSPSGSSPGCLRDTSKLGLFYIVFTQHLWILYDFMMGNIWYTCRFLIVSTTIYGCVWPLVYIFHWGTWWLTLLLGVFLPTLGWNAKLFFQQTICHTGIRRRSRPVNDLGTFQASCGPKLVCFPNHIHVCTFLDRL
jgi:hypothetical protein